VELLCPPLEESLRLATRRAGTQECLLKDTLDTVGRLVVAYTTAVIVYWGEVERGPDNAAESSEHEVRVAASTGNIVALRALVKKGADVESRDDTTGGKVCPIWLLDRRLFATYLTRVCPSHQSTPLVEASGGGREDCVEILLANRAFVHRTDASGNRAAHRAASQLTPRILEVRVTLSCSGTFLSGDVEHPSSPCAWGFGQRLSACGAHMGACSSRLIVGTFRM
jgi:hypothetical protein